MRSRRRKKASSVSVEIVEFEQLTPDEESDRLHLERKVEHAFYEAGLALRELRDRRLYRSTHPNFESYVQDRFGFKRRHPYQLIDAATIVDNLLAEEDTQIDEQMCAVSAQNFQTAIDDKKTKVLPTSEYQVRPLTQLSPPMQREAWQQAVSEVGGKVPPARVVKEVVQRISERIPAPIPFTVGEVCIIVAKDNPELRGKGGCWCIVSSVGDFSCTVNTYDNEYHLKPTYLKSLEFSVEECKQMENIGVRITRLYQTRKMEEAALRVLDSLARIHRSYLTPLEEELLKVLEKKCQKLKT